MSEVMIIKVFLFYQSQTFKTINLIAFIHMKLKNFKICKLLSIFKFLVLILFQVI